ncbi:OsmC family peroxiredoxin [Kocuria rosea]|jgi:osmotically inducible protein OsmC|uniref:OsmC family peroxiredoxin n=1 Tax=Kocuria rosea TaxID=1275 RepID=UPI00203CF68B|nr:OsmC family peroxiredoxin [Kocuria rosea]MCM3686727.1 OsmC family peroxiredoxin [Kocuria rosea]HST73597.1 OsmC family peroxiredoxin [Kocuria rosea]
MPKPVISTASTVWNGDLFNGSGTTGLSGSGLGPFSVDWKARAEEGPGAKTSPEELLAAAHATCYSMALSNGLAQNGTPPTQLDSSAEVTFVAGEGIKGVKLTVRAQVENVSAEDFARLADEAKSGCPVSQALAVDITVDASLV